MGRYDLANNKKKKKSGFVSAPDTIANDLQNQDFSDTEGTGINGVQTVIRGKNLMIRGPNGYQVNIPLRFVSIEASYAGCLGSGRRHELRLLLTPSVARGLSEDIQTAQSDPNERLRVDMPQTRSRTSSEGFQRLYGRGNYMPYPPLILILIIPMILLFEAGLKWIVIV
jgi:hypothetical protein